MSKLQAIVGEIKGLTVVELAELVSVLEQEFQVSAASLSAGAGAGQAAGAAPAAEAKSTLKVELVETGSDKMKVIKALRVVKKELGLMDAKAAAENVPYVIFEEMSREDAEAAKKELEAAGAKVKLS